MHRDDDMPWQAYQDMCDAFIAILIEDIEGYLSRGEADKVNEFLLVAKVPDTDHAILLAILRTTKDHSYLLPARKGFYSRVRSEIRRTTSESATTTLLKGL